MKIKTVSAVIFFLGIAAPAAPAAWNSGAQDAEAPVFSEEVILPAGTIIPIVLADYLNTRNSQVGDVFYADTTYPIWFQQKLVIPKGSNIRGTVTDVVRPGRIKGRGTLAVRFDDILLPNGVTRSFVAVFRGIHGPGEEHLDRASETVTSGSSKGEDAGTVVGTTGKGAIIGAVAGRGSGAAIGAGAGAAAGIATMLFTRGRDLVLTPGTRFDLELKQPMRFARNELEFTGAQIDGAQRDMRSRPAGTLAPTQDSPRKWTIPGIGGF